MKSLNAGQILTTSFNTLPLTGLVKEVIGSPAPNTAMMIYGSPGSQKSTFIIAICAYLQHLGPVCYKAIEEGVSLTFRHKLERLGNVFGQNFVVQDTIEGKKGEFNPFSFVVIDSASVAGVQAEHILAMKKAYPNTMFIYIYQCTKEGLFKGSNNIEHEVDICLKASEGIIYQVKNRCGGTATTSVQAMIDFAKRETHLRKGIPSKKQTNPGFTGLLGKIDKGTKAANLTVEIRFIKRFIRLQGTTKTKRQIVGFIRDLQKAISSRSIVKSSKYANEIMYIQDALLQAYKAFKGTRRSLIFDIHPPHYSKMQNICLKSQQPNNRK